MERGHTRIRTALLTALVAFPAVFAPWKRRALAAPETKGGKNNGVSPTAGRAGVALEIAIYYE